MQTVIIAFGHRARQGKDEAVKAILSARGSEFDVRRYAFADPLKREVNAAAEQCGGMWSLFQLLQAGKYELGQPPFTMLDETTKLVRPVQWDSNPDMTDPLCPLGKQRELLQWWGTEYRRNRDPFYWVRKTAEQVAAEKPQFALIPDLRFVNEAFWVKANQGYTVKVTRHGFAAVGAAHSSEHQLARYTFDIDLTVLDGELDALKREAVQLFDMVVGWLTPPNYKTEDFIPTEETNGAEAEAVAGN